MSRVILLILSLAITAACATGPDDQLRAQTDLLLRQNNIDVDLSELTASEVTAINFALSDSDTNRSEKRMRVESVLRNKRQREADAPGLIMGSMPTS